MQQPYNSYVATELARIQIHGASKKPKDVSPILNSEIFYIYRGLKIVAY